jgi:hypothetical protein
VKLQGSYCPTSVLFFLSTALVKRPYRPQLLRLAVEARSPPSLQRFGRTEATFRLVPSRHTERVAIRLTPCADAVSVGLSQPLYLMALVGQ